MGRGGGGGEGEERGGGEEGRGHLQGARRLGVESRGRRGVSGGAVTW